MMNIAEYNARYLTAAAPPARRGFTLIEMIAVVAIVGLIGVFAGGPTAAYLASMKSRGAAARIVADLRYAQRWAMSSRLRTWVAFDTSTNQYALYVENPSSPGKPGRLALQRALENATATVLIDEPPFTGVTLISVDIGGTSEIEFDSFGKPYNASGVALSTSATVQLSNSVGITIQPVTGLAEVGG